jgi:tRNA nucleotidyltransferase (CCA-adding enzyme)
MTGGAKTRKMTTYLVGGAVRDGLLGLPVEERDWVIVGGDPAAMQALGFAPVDPRFPVFRHPDTGDEFALARRETKRGRGYRGFAVDAGPDVSLEEDLSRRDLTINAMATDDDGTLIDPFGGRDDLDAGLLRHVSPAFVEDPLRVLRVARFAAKLGAYGFRVSHGTHRLMCEMVDAGDMADITAERFGRETEKALQTGQPWRYFEVLQRCGALRELLPSLAEAIGQSESHAETSDSDPIAALKRASTDTQDAVVRLLAACWPLLISAGAAENIIEQLRLDRAAAQLLRRAASAQGSCARATRHDREAIVDLAVQWQGLPGRQRMALSAACAAQSAMPGLEAMLDAALAAARSADIGELRRLGLSGRVLGEAIDRSRRDAAAAALATEIRPS